MLGGAYVTFRYPRISLPRLPAGDYVERGPLAAALASLMGPARRGSAAQIALYIACLRGVQRAVDAGNLDEARLVQAVFLPCAMM